MKEEIKKVYSCDYCKKKYFNKHFAEKHEFACYLNPENFRPCFTCEYITNKKVDIFSGIADQNGQEMERQVSVFYCSAKNIFIHSPQVEIKGNALDLGDEINNPMPKNCDCFKDFSSFYNS